MLKLALVQFNVFISATFSGTLFLKCVFSNRSTLSCGEFEN